MPTIEAKTKPPSLGEEIAKTIETIDRIAAQLSEAPQGNIITSSLQDTRTQALKSFPEIIIWQRPEVPQAHQEKPIDNLPKEPPTPKTVTEIQKPQSPTITLSLRDEHPTEKAEDLSEKEPSAEELRTAEKEFISLNDDYIETLGETKDIDGLQLHIAEIRKIRLHVEKHQQWGQEIFAGKFALLSLLQLSQCDFLNSPQKEKIMKILQENKFLLSVAESTVINTQQRLGSNAYDNYEDKKLDQEFMELVNTNEEVTKQKINQAKISEDETEKEQLMQKFIDNQINCANQGRLAFNNLVEGNLRWSLKGAHRYRRSKGLPFEDLVVYAEHGLMEAAARWDYRKKFQFATYAFHWIRQKITRGIMDEEPMIRLPVHIVGKLIRLRRERAQDPDHPESNEPLSEILASAIKVQHVASLNAPLKPNSDTEFGAMIPDPKSGDVENVVERNDRREMVNKLLSKLPERERRVMEFRFGLNGGQERTLDEVGREFGVSRERIRQLEEKAKRRLRAWGKTKKFKEAF